MAKHENYTPEVVRNLTVNNGRRQEIHSASSFPGLQVIASSSGRKTWAVQVSLSGKTVRTKLADVSPDVGWDEIHEMWAEARRMRQDSLQGLDPRAVQEASRQAAQRENLTVRDVWGMYRESAKWRNLRSSTRDMYETSWRQDVEPDLGSKKITQLKLADMVTAYQRWTNGGDRRIGMARFGIILLRNLWNHAERYELVSEGTRDPLKFFSDEVPGWNAIKVRERDVQDDKLPELWTETFTGDKLNSSGIGKVDAAGAAIRFLLSTGMRLSEARYLRWSEVDLENRRIVLPEGRVKTKRKFVLPLSTLAMQILWTMRYSPAGGLAPGLGQAEFVFGRHAARHVVEAEVEIGVRPRGRRRLRWESDLPLGDPTERLVNIGKRIGVENRLTAHVLRKVFVRIAEAEVGLLDAKWLVNHSISGVAGVTAHYLSTDERRLAEAAEQVGRKIQGLVGHPEWNEPVGSPWYRTEVLGEGGMD